MEKDDDHHQTSPSEFALAVTRIAVAQICQSVGFRAAQCSALEALTDVAARHLRAAAESAAASANSSGRTQSNLYDVVYSLEALASVQGFSGASNVNQTLLASSALTDLAKFVKYTDEIPFAKPILRRSPPQKSVASQPNSASIVGFSHIPRWLPPIPDMGTKETEEEEEMGLGNGIGIGLSGKVDGYCLGGKKMRTELPGKRARVRFKIGRGGGSEEVVGGEVDLRSGVCRGGKGFHFHSKIKKTTGIVGCSSSNPTNVEEDGP
ncbi:hypothetical protein Acr_00g0092660 [Actinidia rufa]|uniref:Bromodomain associated domain-containing protein n=1 Tax=Actinidia rufa TaxID=165716 RepID=A0A7J0DXN1_9ERIC|nr:hypothetical protein Acr_00g0092660 [Actinidia rufa]